MGSLRKSPSGVGRHQQGAGTVGDCCKGSVGLLLGVRSVQGFAISGLRLMLGRAFVGVKRRCLKASALCLPLAQPNLSMSQIKHISHPVRNV